MTFFRRKLPLWHPERASIFLTWRLIGSVPATFPRNPNAPEAGREFLLADRALDRAATGALRLARPDIAQTVVDTLLYGANELRRYDLHAWAVMANHVHILITPYEEVSTIMSRDSQADRSTFLEARVL